MVLICFVPSLSSCHEKAIGDAIFWTIFSLAHELPISKFSRWFFDFPVNFACSRSPRENKLSKSALSKVTTMRQKWTGKEVELRSRDRDNGCRKNIALTISAICGQQIYASSSFELDIVLCSVPIIPLQHRSCSVCMSFVSLGHHNG